MPSVTPLPKAKAARGRKKPTAAALKKKATHLHSQYVRARDGRCVRCGATSGQLQCAHVFGRRYASTRTDENNAYTLDAACHRYLTENPYEHVVFFTHYLGPARFHALRDKAYAGMGHVLRADFWQAEVDRLTELLRGVS